MYKRFLNTNDYIGIITEEALLQLIRGNEDRLAQAEEAAEASIVEYLIDHYEIEKVLSVGKNIMNHNPQVIYPVGTYFYHEGKIWETLRSISGYKSPSDVVYWEICEDLIEDGVNQYSQLTNYQPCDIVKFANVCYQCLEPNGIDFNDIRIPGIIAWEEVSAYRWQANIEYGLWEIVSWEGRYYALTSVDSVDLTMNPFDSDNWGLIGEYDHECEYQFIDTEYVVFHDKVYIPVMDVNADQLREGYNTRQHDPRNSNVKKHLIRLAIYELHKLIAPNNISSTRITDYETSIVWLRDASRLKINPQILRRLDEENKPVTEYAIATFQRDYDPNKNPWQI